MVDHYASIGFSVREKSDLDAVLHRVVQRGRIVPSRHGTYLAWSPGEGIELWASYGPRRELLGIEPYFGGQGRVRVGLNGVVRGLPRYTDLEGGVHAWANPTPDNPHKGDCPLIVDLPDFDLHLERYRPGETLSLRIAAFAEELACHRNDAEFAAVPRKVKHSPEYFVPSGLFVAGGGQPGAFAMFAGHVLRARPVTNPATGRVFRHIVVRTLIGTVDIVVDPAIMQGLPVLGGVVEGLFWLSGRIVEGAEPPPPPPPPPD